MTKDLETQKSCFGTVWVGPGKKKRRRNKSSKDLKDRFKEEWDELNELVETGASYKDVTRRMWKMKEMIGGPKVDHSKPACINNPQTGDLITDRETIREVSLEHCARILQKNAVRECDELEHSMKVRSHDVVMNETDDGQYELDRDMYYEVLDCLRKKNKNMFKLLNKAGDRYKEAIYLYMKRILKEEAVPTEFHMTWLTAIWKRKGSALDLNMMRYIHTKVWDAKLCEALVTKHMKPKIVKACPNIQIGGIPKASSVEHLVTLKTWMRLKETSNEGGIIQTFDMEKFFDKESLLDTMVTLKEKAEIDNKDYRMWFKLNEDTNIRVRTSVGESEPRLIKNSLGQGSFGAALASSLNIGCAIKDTFGETSSTHIGTLPLNAIVMQDDIAKLNDNLGQAREGCNKINNTLMRKQLAVNHDRCKYLIVGPRKFRKDTLAELERQQMRLGGVVIKHAVSEKYLGDWVNELGCKESIDDTIKERIGKQTGKANDIITLADAPMMGSDGSSRTAIRLFEAQVIPALLFNCESWIGITETQINELQGFQDKFIRKLMHLPVSTPKAILHWDCGMEMMKWRIAKRKLLFLRKTMKKENSNLCKRAIMNEVILNIKGLGHECNALSTTLGLPDLRDKFDIITRGSIERAIREQGEISTRAEVEASRKVGDRASNDPKDREYLNYMTLPDSRIWMRVRARSIKGVKVNNKNSNNDLQCRFCDEDANESQEHLEVCKGGDYERRNLKMSRRKDLVIFWRRMTTKMTDWGRGIR